MLKLNENVKFKRLPDHFKHHLIILVDRDDKWNMFLFNVLILDILLLFLLIANGIKPFTLIALPFFLIINCWMILIFFKNMSIYKNNLEFVIYKGSSFIAMSCCWCILALKMYYAALGLNVLFFITATVVLVASIIGSFHYYLVKFSNTKKNNRSISSWSVYLLTAGSAFGYMISQFTLHFSESVINIFMSIVSLLAASLFALIGTKFIHQFLFIKYNQEFINKIGKDR
ncbi:hypothetical protein [Bacillus atrophaeus]|uniref:hypothetical protein n=1 Tax=Bacillus atrophaeus TaxID=1452 RepID=UPI000B457083|nr:hypothetical protein [Bacillus atrophaeus]MCY8858389.1 hypothetical protein [Bacillus atrophaeus]